MNIKRNSADSYNHLEMRNHGTQDKLRVLTADTRLQTNPLVNDAVSLRTDKSTLPVSDEASNVDDAQEYDNLLDDMSFMTFVTVKHRSIKVLEIQDANIGSPSFYEFELIVFLDTDDSEFVDANALSILTQILRLHSMARPIRTKHVTWLSTNFTHPHDIPFPTDTLIVIHWDSSHPFYITGRGPHSDDVPIWRGALPIGLHIDFDSTKNTTTFMVPKNYAPSLYYYCWNHESMGVNPILLVNPGVFVDDMQLTVITPSVVMRSEGPLRLYGKGVYAVQENFNASEFNRQIIVSVEPEQHDDDIDEMIREMIDSVIIFTPENLPTLLDTSSCLDIAGVLKASRLKDRATTLVMQANVTSEECGCILSHIYLDVEFLQSQYASSESAYAMYLTELRNNITNEVVHHLWTMAMDELPKYGKHTQLAVLSCANTATSDTFLHIDTDFSFALKENAVGVNITTLHCIAAFCMVVIHTDDCMSTKHVHFVSPMVANNMLRPSQLLKHTLAASNVLVQAMDVGGTELLNFSHFNGFPVLHALRSTISFLCSNIDQTPCSTDRGLGIMHMMAGSYELTSLQMNHFTTEKSIMFTEPPYTTVTEWGTLFTASQMDFTMVGISPTVQRYLQGNVRCPKNMIFTANTDTLQYEGASVKVACMFCGLNTYYSPKPTSPTIVVNTTRTMYIRKFQSTPWDQSNPDIITEYEMQHARGTPISYFLTEGDGSLVSSLEQMHGEECMVDIGTMLLLTLADTNMTSIVLRLTCEKVVLPVEIVNVNSVSFYVTKEFAGKAIFVQVTDATKSEDMSVPAVFFPRAVQEESECVACPAGKFGGSMGASDINSCKNSVVVEPEHTPADVAEPDVAHHADDLQARRSLYAQDIVSLPLLTYFEIDGQVVLVYEIDRSQRQEETSDFAIVAFIGNVNSSHLKAHIVDVEVHILRLYYALSPLLVNATFNVTRVHIRERDELYMSSPVILTMEGTYALARNVDTESAFVVTMAISLPFTLAEFDVSKQVVLKRTVANVAGVSLADVTIASISSIPANAQRRLFASALRIDMRINAANSNAAAQLAATLSNPSTLNTALASAGLPAATMLVAPAIVQTNSNTSTTVSVAAVVRLNILRNMVENISTPVLIAAAIGAAAFVIMIPVIIKCRGSKHKDSDVFTQHEHMLLTQNPQQEFANIHHTPMSQIQQGRYYSIHDQSGDGTWHPQG